ncbi:hypothetical protein I5907_17780 [Panacibacter sp. DH6]|uniref:Uncharacterized protein n=1 Tax=Panacibacter microcysteis TaxID=2793269 RepID=A0A931GZ90_9BACT|nr:hypothetical protein [Panacibacter microcysteis]MBG9378092.1 hypothetical protein [Panacibacter microcysteis]
MKYLAMLPVCLLSVVTYAQKQSTKFTFKLGDEYELPRKTEDLAFFGNQKDGIVNLSLKDDELYITRFDAQSLHKTAEQKIELPEATKNFTSELVVNFNDDNYYWMHSDWDKSSETEMLYYDKIDVTAGKIKDANHKLFQATRMAGTLVGNGLYSAKVVGKYRYNYNAERSKLLISYRLYPEQKSDKKNFDKIGLQVFDDKMNKLWGGEFTMPYTEAIMDNSDFSLDAKGNAYMLAKVYDSDSRRERDKETGNPAYHYEVLKFTKESKKIISAKINLGDNYIREATLIESSLNEMIVACTYSKKSKGNGTDGIFLASLNQEGILAKYREGYYEFPGEELQKFESSRTKRKIENKEDFELPNLRVRNVIVEKDGSVFFACEEYKLVVSTSNFNGSIRTTYTYYYEDIYAAKIDAAGKFLWMRKIPKKQRGTAGTGTMSFKLISDETGYYFLYLDNIHNMNLAEDETPKYHIDGAGGQVIVSKITSDGTTTKELLFDTRDEDIMIYPTNFYKINGNQFIGRARIKKKLFQPVLITSK